MVGKAGSGCMRFCSISGILSGQFSAGQLEHSVKPFGKERETGLGTLWSGQLALFFSAPSWHLPGSHPAVLDPSTSSVLWGRSPTQFA